MIRHLFKQTIASVLLCVLVAFPGPAQSDPGARQRPTNRNVIAFEDVTSAAGIAYTGQSWGAAWGDFNADGYPDIWTSNHGIRPSLYLNRGDGTFEQSAMDILDPESWRTAVHHDEHGAAWADFDNDGDQDLFQVAAGGPNNHANFLFENIDGVLLRDVAGVLDVDNPLARGRMPLWLDADRDGRLDLLLTTMGSEASVDPTRPVLLYRQTDEGFAEVTVSAGLTLPKRADFATLYDFDHDWRPELAIGVRDAPLRVFALNGERYYETTLAMGLDSFCERGCGVTDAVVADFTGDLIGDIYGVRGEEPLSDLVLTDKHTLEGHLEAKANEVGCRFVANNDVTISLYPSFQVSPSDIYIGAEGLHPQRLPFTVSLTDRGAAGIKPHVPGVDDGIFVGVDPLTGIWTLVVSQSGAARRNFVLTAKAQIKGLTAIGFDPAEAPRADLFLVQHDGRYYDRAEAAGFVTPSSGRDIGVGDFDNDMDLDLYVVATGPVANLPNKIYVNRGNGSFDAIDAGQAAGSEAGRGDAVAVADYDVDGFLDLFVTNGMSKPPFEADGPYQLFRNRGNGNHWLEIDLEGSLSNRDGHGASVVLSAGGVTQMRQSGNSIHHRAQDYRRLHFGLGAHEAVERITVHWPSGIVQVLEGVPANQLVHIVESAGR